MVNRYFGTVSGVKLFGAQEGILQSPILRGTALSTTAFGSLGETSLPGAINGLEAPAALATSAVSGFENDLIVDARFISDKQSNQFVRDGKKRFLRRKATSQSKRSTARLELQLTLLQWWHNLVTDCPCMTWMTAMK